VDTEGKEKGKRGKEKGKASGKSFLPFAFLLLTCHCDAITKAENRSS
jgi:hypothetical protein